MTQPGVSIIVLSHKRLGALRALLESLLRQDLAGIPIELIVCNNSPDVSLRPSRFSGAGPPLSPVSRPQDHQLESQLALPDPLHPRDARPS